MRRVLGRVVDGTREPLSDGTSTHRPICSLCGIERTHDPTGPCSYCRAPEVFIYEGDLDPDPFLADHIIATDLESGALLRDAAMDDPSSGSEADVSEATAIGSDEVEIEYEDGVDPVLLECVEDVPGFIDLERVAATCFIL